MRVLKTDFDQEYFDRWFYRGRSGSRNKKRVKEVIKHKRGGKLLEVGCAEGDFLKEAEPYFDVTGLDLSEYAVAKAHESLGNKATVGDVEEDRLRAENYDVIVTFNLLEHVRNPKKVIHKLFRALRKGGVLFGSVPNNYGVIGGLATRASNVFDRTHFSTHRPRVWRKYFISAGFKRISFHGETVLASLSTYVKGAPWRHVCQNLVFVCRK